MPVTFTLALMKIARFCVAAVILFPLLAAAEIECKKPPAGRFEGACEALGGMPIGRDHAGAAWVSCRADTMSPGYGLAAWYSAEAIPFWKREIASYLAQLKRSLPRSKFSTVQKDQTEWLEQLPSLEAAIAKDVEEEGKRAEIDADGTLNGMFFERRHADLFKDRALQLGCALEEAKGVPHDR